MEILRKREMDTKKDRADMTKRERGQTDRYTNYGQVETATGRQRHRNREAEILIDRATEKCTDRGIQKRDKGEGQSQKYG